MNDGFNDRTVNIIESFCMFMFVTLLINSFLAKLSSLYQIIHLIQNPQMLELWVVEALWWRQLFPLSRILWMFWLTINDDFEKLVTSKKTRLNFWNNIWKKIHRDISLDHWSQNLFFKPIAKQKQLICKPSDKLSLITQSVQKDLFSDSFSG